MFCSTFLPYVVQQSLISEGVCYLIISAPCFLVLDRFLRGPRTCCAMYHHHHHHRLKAQKYHEPKITQYFWFILTFNWHCILKVIFLANKRLHLSCFNFQTWNFWTYFLFIALSTCLYKVTMDIVCSTFFTKKDTIHDFFIFSMLPPVCNNPFPCLLVLSRFYIFTSRLWCQYRDNILEFFCTNEFLSDNLTCSFTAYQHTNTYIPTSADFIVIAPHKLLS